MKRIFSFMAKPWLWTLIAIVLLSLIIWYIGPLIAIAEYKPLTSETIRLIAIFMVFIIWGLNNLRQKNAIQKSEARIEKNLIEDSKLSTKPESKKNIISPDEKILSDRLGEAIKLLRQSQFGKKGKFYSLPWYMIIGASGTGKTTALKNSGLHFPLRSKLGAEPIQGAGGTRYCDWWFTDEAILIDTAGRYTTQDSPKKVESKAWINFLARLKKIRPKRPLNGIILTISIQDILQKTNTQKTIQTTAIKQRIQELNNHLGMMLPVYVLFTKTDLVAGFNGFFSDLEKEGQEQIWGITFKDKRVNNIGNLLKEFDTEYTALMQRINNRVLKRLDHERNPQRRTLIYEFPHQMNGLKQPIHDFLSNIFTPNQFEEPFLLRGIYFISSTQTNMASQWVTGVLPTDQRSPPVDIINKEPKTFFITKLLQNVIFAEANMATLNTKAKMRHRWIYRIAFVTTTIIFTGMLFAWSNSQQLNLDYISQLEQQVEQYQEITNGGLENQKDWTVLATGLSELKLLRTGYQEGTKNNSLQQGIGLYQGHKLGSQARLTYLKALEIYFMHDLNNLLIQQVKGAQDDDGMLYESLKFYLMLYYPEKMDTKSFTIWINILWNKIIPGEHNQQIREHLNTHLKIALEEKILPPSIEQGLVDKSRAILTITPLDQRLYRRLKSDYNQEHQGQYTVTQTLGNKANIIFYRRSGKTLDEGIPELFTYKGFHTGFNVLNKKLAQHFTDEQWIYGDTINETLSEDSIDKISERVNEYYFNEYTKRWQQLIGDLAIKPFTTVNQGQTVIRLLASSNQPLLTLLNSIRKNTALGEIPAVSESTKEMADMLTDRVLSHEKDRLERLIPKSADPSNLKLPGYAVSDKFDELNNYINHSDGLPLQQLQQSLDSLNDYFQTLAYSDNVKQAAFQANLDSQEGSSAITPVRQAIAEAPPEIKKWFNSVMTNTNTVTAAATQGHMNNIWQTEVISFFNTALKNRYPIDPTSQQDIKLADFTTFFAPKGIIDSYFINYIEPFVDKSRSQWRWRKNIGLSNSSLRFFEKAQQIKLAFFNNSTQGPEVRFALKPRSLDNAATGFLLETSGTSIRYSHGPIRTSNFIWPEPNSDISKISFTLASKGNPVSVRTEGEWSWFRLLDAYASQHTQNNGNLLIMFIVDGIDAQYELIPQSIYNPYNNQDIKGLKLPRRL